MRAAGIAGYPVRGKPRPLQLHSSRSGACRCTVSPSAHPHLVQESLIPETLQQMQQDAELQATLAALETKGQAALTREEQRSRRRSLAKLGLPGFHEQLQNSGLTPLQRQICTTLQLNIGLYCNQACTHCHVESSPARTEMMDRQTADRCLQLLADSENVTCLDITGGAPELNSEFRYLVEQARALGSVQIIDRCNLTVLCEPGQEDLPEFLAKHQVRVVASLPCYSQENVDKQRGRQVFERSIEGLKKLNAVGYGQPGSGLVLDLVYNPGGAFLAPPQAKLQPAYEQELQQLYGVTFSSLLCLNNMPIKRFADFLIRQGKLSEYMQLLVEAFNPASVSNLMCHQTLSVAWDGRLYDCDFNQQLDLPILSSKVAGSAAVSASSSGDMHSSSNSSSRDTRDSPPQQRGLTVWDLDSLDELTGVVIRTDSHCYGCTAGSGSGCQGATA